MSRLDTAFNYRDFASHTTLARVAGDLLGKFEISTKVGSFPDGHSLAPFRLRRAVEQCAAVLGQAPAVMFLHNPERSLDGLAPSAGREMLATAARVLIEAKRDGLIRRWGISSWRAAVTAQYAEGCPTPDVLMTRCGLTVGGSALDAADRLAGLFGLCRGSRWGMAPFGGDVAAVAWPVARAFSPDQPCGRLQAAFAAAYHLPKVARVAVGTDRADHLAELVAAAGLDIPSHRIDAYRSLLDQRKATVTG